MLAGVLLLAMMSCDRKEQLRKCSAACRDLDKSSRAYCTEPSPSACLAEIDDATARCTKRCEEEYK